MKDTIGLFYEILQIAVGTRKSLSCQPSEKELVALYELSKKQALTAIAFAGLSKYLDSLGEASPYAGGVRGSMVYLKWLGLTAKVAQRNREVSAACVELVKQYAHDGMACCVLKGQGNLENYPEDMRECRTPGDIDVWCKTMDENGIDIAVADLDGRGAHYEKYQGNRAVIEYVKMLWRQTPSSSPCVGGEPSSNGSSSSSGSKFAQKGQTPLCKNEEPEVRYHHIDAPTVNGVEVEAHFRPLFLDSPLRNWRLLRWFRENEQFGHHDAKIGDVVLPVPTTSFNAVYQLCHIYRHLFDEGIGLRQLLDYYFVLKTLSSSPCVGGESRPDGKSLPKQGGLEGLNEEIMHTLSRFGMKKFAGAVMYVIAKVFANDDDTANAYDDDNLCLNDWQKRWPWMICEPNEKEGKFLLSEIMLAGNFGKYDTRIAHSTSRMGHAWEKLKHNMRLVRHYPEEVLCEPFFRLYHYLWRRFSLWRY